MSYQEWAMLIHRRTYRDLIRQRHTHAAACYYLSAFSLGCLLAFGHAMKAHQFGLTMSFSGGTVIFATLAFQQAVLYGRVKRFLARATANATESKLSRLADLADQSDIPRVKALHESLDRWSDAQQQALLELDWDEEQP